MKNIKLTLEELSYLEHEFALWLKEDKQRDIIESLMIERGDKGVMFTLLVTLHTFLSETFKIDGALNDSRTEEEKKQ